MRWWVILAVAVMPAITSCAQEPTASEVATGVSQEVMSPFCDGLTIHDCPSQQSEELRFEILGMARQGMSEEEIVDDLVSRYGERIRGVPRPEGTGLLVWILPGLAVIGGAVLAFILARRFSDRGARAFNEPAPSPTTDERARLESELAAAREKSCSPPW
jgi:cytochrome c-type biogenesis protein CcmH